MYKKVLSCVGNYKKYAILTPVTIIGEVVMEVLIPTVMALIIDNGIRQGDIGYVVKMGLVMMLMAAVSLCFGAISGRFAAVAGMGFSKNLRSRLFRKVQSFSFANVDKFSTASLVTRLTTDVTNTQNAFMMVIRMAFRAPIMLIFAIIMTVKINAKLSLVFVCIVPVLAIAIIFILSKAHPRFLSMLNKYDGMNSRIQENLIGIRVVKAFVREPFEKKNFEKTADDVRKAQFFAEKLIILVMPIMQICIYSCIVAILWFGGYMAISGEMKIGQIARFITYVMQILISLMMLSMIFMMVIISRASIERIAEVLSEEPEIKDVEGTSAKAEDGSIVFENVNFSYFKDKNNLALENINLSIKSGETIGIIGGTGSSKTSLVQLIPRLYDTLTGNVIVGGHNVKDYNLETLRNEVAMVLQKNVLFSGTIKENLLWGDEKATDDEIRDACKSACADDFIMNFPNGYETDLGQGGVNVSGGQKQRICIARALIKKPKIIILDDSTSALDYSTDLAFRHAIREQMKDTTIVMVSQRATSLKDADKIIVMDDGKIVGMGKHSELLENCHVYSEIYNSQLSNKEENEDA